MILFYSTKNRQKNVSLFEALMQGLADDGGLFMPHVITPLPAAFFEQMSNLTFPEIAFEVSQAWLQDTIPKKELKEIVDKALSFDAPVVCLSKGLYSLELFHGPSLSFKDFGARFMAQLLHYYLRAQGDLNILVATSGDTGSAIGQAFYGVPGVKVWILYPSGKISWIQEQQLTTMGSNVIALEIEGTFDDCQRLVKQAFNDQELRKKLHLTSANSINIGRLIPQSFYYFNAYARIGEKLPLVISVPSGNFGNLTAGLFAKRMGLPVDRFIAATNVNDSVPHYLKTGSFEPHPSLHTLSNAMDVGNPSNFARMLDLYENNLEKMRQDIFGVKFTDSQTESAMREVYRDCNYVLDPHGAVAYFGLKSYLKQHEGKVNGLFLETAHPAKFAQDVERILATKVPLPERLQHVLAREKRATLLPAEYPELRAELLQIS